MLRRKISALVVAFLIFAGTMMIVTQVGTEFIPKPISASYVKEIYKQGQDRRD